MKQNLSKSATHYYIFLVVFIIVVILTSCSTLEKSAKYHDTVKNTDWRINKL